LEPFYGLLPPPGVVVHLRGW
ncbi:hypothetical protein BAE44_0019310, partial [Dichanthelium oligosanthes]